MKICQVIASTGEGGLEKHVRELSSGLVDRGHSVAIVCGHEYASTLPSKLHYACLDFSRSRWNPILRFQLLDTLKRCSCDVIHAHANKATSLVGALRKHLDAPLVGTLHGLKNDTRAFARMDHVIAVSHKAAQRLSAVHHSVVYNGIRCTPPQPIDLRALHALPPGLPVLCALGRLAPVKGFDMLLEAIDGLALCLLIAGEGDERATLEKRIATLSPPTICKLIGYQPDPVSLIAASDGVVISSHREGFPYVLVEALVNRVPVISTDVSDVREFLHGSMVVPVNSPQALRATLRSFLDAPEQGRALLLPAFDLARQRLTIDAMIDQTLAIYAQARETWYARRRPNPPPK